MNSIKLQNRVDTVFMNSEISERYGLLFTLADKI